MSPVSKTKSGTVHIQDNSAKLLLAADAITPPILAVNREKWDIFRSSTLDTKSTPFLQSWMSQERRHSGGAV